MFMSDFQRVKAISKSPFEIFSKLSITFFPVFDFTEIGDSGCKK